MGVDINCYIEYRDKFTGEWQVFGSDMLLNRNSYIMGKMGGYCDLEGKKNRIYESRGLPKDVSYDILEKCTLSVIEDNTYGNFPSLIYIWRSAAEEYVKSGKSVYIGEDNSLILDFNNWGYTWFSMDEYNSILHSLNVVDSELPIDYLAVLRLMAFFQDMGKEVRLIVWFS